MNKTFSFITLIFILALLALPVIAQETSPATPDASLALLGIPPMLSFLIGVNNRGTQFVKLWLAAPKLPINLPPETQRVVVSVSSLAIGLVAAIFIPDALTWLPERVQAYPIAAVILAAIASSFGGALAQYVLDVLSGISKAFTKPETMYKTTTEISAPSSDTPSANIKATAQAVEAATSHE